MAKSRNPQNAMKKAAKSCSRDPKGKTFQKCVSAALSGLGRASAKKKSSRRRRSARGGK
jgi:hypothetical protein